MKKPNRKVIWFSVVGVLLVLLVVGGVFFYQYQMKEAEKRKVEEINGQFHEVVRMKEDSSLYKHTDDGYIEVGTLKQGVVLRLEKTDITSSKDTYFKVADLPYYVSYQVVEEGVESPLKEDIYVPWNEVLETKENASIETENGTITFQDVQKFSIMKKMDDAYQVLFQSHWVTISKDSVESVTPVEGETASISKKISVLHYTKIEDNSLNQQISWLKEQGYTSITKDDYLDFINGRIQLKDKMILLSFDAITDSQRTLLETNSITYMNTSDLGSKWLDKDDSTSLEKKYYAYVMTNRIDKAKMDKILAGENVYVAPPVSPYATQVAVLNYHFFYDGSQGNHCGESICLDSRKFEEQLKYLKDNGYKTLTIEEYRAWIYGEIEVPRKSVLLTVDDGAMGTGKTNGNQLIPLLEKYDLHATLFLITAWWPKENYLSPNLDVESHGYDIHINATCNGSSKARALCLSKNELIADLNESVRLLGTKTAFCYPFYASNETVRQATKEAGFKLGFGGGNVKSTRNSHKYLIPRYPIYDSITMAQFKNMIGG